jgi:hypothetical protein
LGLQPEAGGKLHLRLNSATRPIEHKYREGQLKRTLKREFKVRETVQRQTGERSNRGQQSGCTSAKPAGLLPVGLLVDCGCICWLCIAVAAALEAGRFLWLAAIRMGCLKWLAQGLVLPNRKERSGSFWWFGALGRYASSVDRPLTGVVSLAMSSWAVLEAAAVC